MKRLIVSLVSAAGLLVSATEIRGQDLLVPAGTLLQCTLNEPRFSSATAFVGDPVLCHLKSFQEFGRNVFPRGSMLAGHLEADKEPGHFVGKGYLKLTFDRVIVPTGDLPLPAKVIAAKGFKVDKQGDIKGKGHATRRGRVDDPATVAMESPDVAGPRATPDADGRRSTAVAAHG